MDDEWGMTIWTTFECNRCRYYINYTICLYCSSVITCTMCVFVIQSQTEIKIWSTKNKAISYHNMLFEEIYVNIVNSIIGRHNNGFELNMCW